ncbi:unnamed protein product [Auanema sp. JU1783]|nr:unnamed protein product [Auanema sp. JU1783]
MEGFEIGPDGKPCRACISVEEMMKKGRELAEKKLKNSQSTNSEIDMKQQYPTTSSDHHTNCPVDKDELGRSTWNLLHTMSVYYPENPTEQKKTATANFLENLGKTYPCEVCAEDLQKDLKKEPPNLTNRKEFALWMCHLHNKVNGKLGKPDFDCSNVFERWKDGWKDGTCDF